MKHVLISLLFLLIEANVLAQHVTIAEKDVPLAKIMNLIRKQTGYYFSFGTGITGKGTKVSLVVTGVPLKAALDNLFTDLPFTYIITDKVIVITSRTKNDQPEVQVSLVIKGRVQNEQGEPLPQATVSVMNGDKGTVTNDKGAFILPGLPSNTTVQISSVGYESQQFVITSQTEINAQLKPAATGLDEAVVIGYGKTSRRLNTGDVFKVKGQEIVDQPVSNFVAALPGRVPGMLISQKSGLPGASYNIEIHGRSSIGAAVGSIPVINTLVLVDGIPFAPNNNNLPTIAAGSAFGAPGRSAFDLINLNDIESIEVLKDADATAIYGSRGANGVILVTTKKGARGKPVIHIDVNTGLGQITRYPRMMNTQQYVAMRRAAIINDGNTPNSTNAPDLYKWDTTRYTDLKKLLIGGTANIYNAQVSVTGGTNTIQYFLSGSGRKQTAVYPGDFADNTCYTHAALHHHSTNNKLKAGLSVMATHDNNNSLARDLTAQVMLPPNAPAFYDSLGNLIWQQGGYSFSNPMNTLRQPYHVVTDNILTGVDVSYTLLKDLLLKLNGGLNNIKIDESILQPRSTQNTFAVPNAFAQAFFAYSKLKSFIAEPQLAYTTRINKGKFSLLAGGTYQQLTTRITNEAVSGYPNDASLTDVSKATTHTVTPTNSDYKYVGVFGRVSYDWLNKYLINLTGRRDGSSRFGSGHQFGNFGAIGAAWVFSNEPFINKQLPFISFGKLRASYGVTGSDQVGDYKYLDRWLPTARTYLGNTGLAPFWPANPYYSWEENRKLEGAVELGLLNNQLLVSLVYYQNRSSNQIVTKSIPAITGFDRLFAANYPAIVQNSGWEISWQYKSKLQKDLTLGANLVVTIPKNKLLSFPNISDPLYLGNNLYINKSLSAFQGFTYTGIDPRTGLFTFKDYDSDGTISYPYDYAMIADLTPTWYGSLTNKLNFKNWALTCLVEFKKQTAYNFLNKIYSDNPPGFPGSNLPALLADYWQKQGDASSIQKLTASTNSAAYAQIDNFLNSSGVFSDASYVRIKTLAVSYDLCAAVLKKMHLKTCRLYVAANNLALFTRFKATDPETMDLFTLPPLRTIAAGIHLGF
jgi:TonB-linked SusC/RagA family outer membrane protein